MAKVCCARRLAVAPGFSESSIARLRCDSMALDAVETPSGMLKPAQEISVTRHWWVPRMRSAIDIKVWPANSGNGPAAEAGLIG